MDPLGIRYFHSSSISLIPIHHLFQVFIGIAEVSGSWSGALIHSVLSVAISRGRTPHDCLRVAFQPEAIAITS